MSICDNCIHDEVCGLEDNHEESITFCADMIPKEQEPKTGHWIGDNRGFYIYAKCSECGSVHDTATNYCPNCGCLMDRTEFDEYVKKEGDL